VGGLGGGVTLTQSDDVIVGSGTGTARVRELVFHSDDGSFRYGSGRFAVTWVPDDPRALREPCPEAVVLSEALSWAQAHAQVVVVEGQRAGDPDG